MFPVTITLHNSIQLAAVLAALEEDTTIKSAALNGAPEVSTEIAPRKTKADKPQPEKVAAPEAQPEKVAPAPESQAEKADAVTYQQAADAVTKLAKTAGRDIAVGVLKQFGAVKLPDVKPDQYAAVLAACQEAEGV